MTDEMLRVAIIGCGRMGQEYAKFYSLLDNTEIVAIAEYNDERRKAVGEQFGVKALYKDAEEMYGQLGEVPDLAVTVLPGKFIKDAVIASAQAGVRGVSTDKPIGARLSEVDAMIDTCAERGVVFHGGNLQSARTDIQEAASWLRRGDFGEIRGATVHAWGGEISGGGCQHIAVLRLLTQAEITEVIAWGKPQEALEADDDTGLIINGRFTLSTGIEAPIFGEPTPYRGVDVWTENALLRWDWGDEMDIYQGFDANGARVKSDRKFTPCVWPQYSYLASSILSFISAVENGTEMAVSGHDLRQSLEAAIAAKYSALWGSVPLTLPLEDRSLALYPRPYRWLGGDHAAF
ncbi:MAG: Gfo/Idh/MocA family oxidoreductase [Chloroflexi bacterium]|nr:Gfo/Idh/MocA family oxidoreductase [Chloroflexota bacterium]